MQAKLVAKSGLANMDATLAPYIEQKLKTMIVSEFIRASGETMNLVANGFAGAGLVTSVVAGGGLPLVIVGAVLGTFSMGVVYLEAIC